MFPLTILKLPITITNSRYSPVKFALTWRRLRPFKLYLVCALDLQVIFYTRVFVRYLILFFFIVCRIWFQAVNLSKWQSILFHIFFITFENMYKKVEAPKDRKVSVNMKVLVKYLHILFWSQEGYHDPTHFLPFFWLKVSLGKFLLCLTLIAQMRWVGTWSRTSAKMRKFLHFDFNLIFFVY